MSNINDRSSSYSDRDGSEYVVSDIPPHEHSQDVGNQDEPTDGHDDHGHDGEEEHQDQQQWHPDQQPLGVMNNFHEQAVDMYVAGPTWNVPQPVFLPIWPGQQQGNVYQPHGAFEHWMAETSLNLPRVNLLAWQHSNEAHYNGDERVYVHGDDDSTYNENHANSHCDSQMPSQPPLLVRQDGYYVESRGNVSTSHAPDSVMPPANATGGPIHTSSPVPTTMYGTLGSSGVAPTAVGEATIGLRVCRHWMKNKCRFGSRCRFVHITLPMDLTHLMSIPGATLTINFPIQANAPASTDPVTMVPHPVLPMNTTMPIGVSSYLTEHEEKNRSDDNESDQDQDD